MPTGPMDYLNVSRLLWSFYTGHGNKDAQDLLQLVVRIFVFGLVAHTCKKVYDWLKFRITRGEAARSHKGAFSPSCSSVVYSAKV